jgi:hypothetical protein
MEILITENKIFEIIYKYIDMTLNPSNINFIYGMGEDEDGYLSADIEDKNLLIFYKGNWYGEEDSDIIFFYYKPDYYGDSPSSKPHRDKSPILEVIGDYAKHLDHVFSDYWEEPMKKWFQYNFKLPVKTIST